MKAYLVTTHESCPQCKGEGVIADRAGTFLCPTCKGVKVLVSQIPLAEALKSLQPAAAFFTLEPGCENLAPTKAHNDDAAWDLRSRVNTLIRPGERITIPTGIRLALPPEHEAQIRPRSGMALRHGITVLNSPGTIDAGYRGEVGVLLQNHSEDPYHVACGDRIAQMAIARLAPVQLFRLNLPESLPASLRGEDGFGSSGQ
jgi:dUTP pyrophosphatase